jgi:DNA-binding MarR family transcriptional regulator
MREERSAMYDHELLARLFREFRRNGLRDFVFNIVSTLGDFDYTLPHMATLLLLDEEGELTISQMAEKLGRSPSATSRLLDLLVVRGMVSRREDERDRRARRVTITEQGRQLIATLEQRRADAQIAVMEYLSLEEQTAVTRGMTLLVEAGRRRKETHESPTTGTKTT